MKYPDDFLNKVIQGDCLEIMKQMPDKCVDLVLTDPPYGVTQNEWDTVVDFELLWYELHRIGKENSAFVFTAQQPFTTDLIQSNRANFRYDLIWYKALGTGFLNANKMPMRNHEHILIFYTKLPVYNPIMTAGKMRRKGSNKGNTTTNYGNYKGQTKTDDTYYPQSVIDITNGDRTTENDHPTQKPVSLFSYLIATYSKENDIVFDPFLGSGTTAVAAKQLGRKYIGIELSQKYVDVANERLKQDLLF